MVVVVNNTISKWDHMWLRNHFQMWGQKCSSLLNLGMILRRYVRGLGRDDSAVGNLYLFLDNIYLIKYFSFYFSNKELRLILKESKIKNQ